MMTITIERGVAVPPAPAAVSGATRELGAMVADFHPPAPPPAAPLGQRLDDLFGRQRWDFLEASAPAAGHKPAWRTVKDYPLPPRRLWQRWQDPDTLIGVRFERETYYALMDIDATGPYCQAGAIADMRAGLETLGIARMLLLRSSYSNGLHLYIPLPELTPTFDLAVALAAGLQAQGFTVAKGQLEIFPNPKPYGVEQIILYNGHRLPLQPGTGACLLDDDLNPIGDGLAQFFQMWDIAAAQQDFAALQYALQVGRDNRRKKPRLDRRPIHRAAVWRADMEADMAAGWSGPGQTNHLLKVIACHGHVFLQRAGDEPIEHSLETAIALPGYRQHCRHQHEIRRRVRAWCRSVQHYYWPYGGEPKRRAAGDSDRPNQNQQRALDAQQRIQQAYEQIQASGLPTTVRGLMQRLAQLAGSSFQTLQKYKFLWHPDYLEPSGVTPLPAAVSSSI